MNINLVSAYFVINKPANHWKQAFEYYDNEKHNEDDKAIIPMVSFWNLRICLVQKNREHMVHTRILVMH